MIFLVSLLVYQSSSIHSRNNQRLDIAPHSTKTEKNKYFAPSLSPYLPIYKPELTSTLNYYLQPTFIVVLLFIAIFYAFFVFFRKLYPSELYGVGIPVPLLCIGGASAIFYCFIAKTDFLFHITLWSFMFSNLSILVIHDIPEVAVLAFILYLVLLFFFPLDFVFIVILIGRVLISPEISQWGFALITQLTNISLFYLLDEKEENPIFFSNIFIFILLFILGFLYYQDPTHRYFMIFVLALAGASAIYFLFLSRTGLWQVLSFSIYFLINLLLGISHSNNERTLFGVPDVTLIFILVNLLMSLFLVITSKVRDDKLSLVINEGKEMLVFVYIVMLYFLSQKLHHDCLWLEVWIDSMSFQIGFLSLLRFLIKRKKNTKE